MSCSNPAVNATSWLKRRRRASERAQAAVAIEWRQNPLSLNGRRRDQVARGLEAEEGDRLLDRPDLDLQAEGGRVGQAQRLRGQGLVVGHFFRQHGDVDVFLLDAAEQFHHDGRQRRQVLYALHQLFGSQLAHGVISR
jgi:hypothetical protein